MPGHQALDAEAATAPLEPAALNAFIRITTDGIVGIAAKDPSTGPLAATSRSTD